MRLQQSSRTHNQLRYKKNEVEGDQLALRSRIENLKDNLRVKI
jgi:hypothetical protein